MADSMADSINEALETAAPKNCTPLPSRAPPGSRATRRCRFLHMRVLIIDDERPIRVVLGRILTKYFTAADVIEAEDGLEALTRLSEARFDIVFLDLGMPTISGEEVLKAIRRSSEHARLPVIVVTGMASPEKVLEVVKLGVADYLVKPFRPSRVVERLEKVLELRQEGSDDLPRTQLLELTPATKVLLVDGDEEYREFFKRHMATRCQVTAVGDGLLALQRCRDEPPDAVFIGPEIGLLKGDLLAQTIRHLSQSGSTRMVGLVPPALVKRHQKRSPFHVVLPRTFVGSVLDQSLEMLVRQPNRIVTVLDLIPRLKLAMIAAVEQACTSSFHTEVQFRADAGTIGAKGKAVVASVRIEASDGVPPLLLEMGCSQKGLKQLRGKQHDAGTAEAALCEVVAFVADRVVQAMGERQFVAMAHPVSAKTIVGVVGVEPDSMALPFGSTIGSATLLLTLRVEPHAATAT